MKIKYLPYQPHCFAFGGFEIQMLSTLDAVIDSGIEASTLDIWDRYLDFDILHCWGLELSNYENVYWAKKSGKKVVMTALLPYYETIYERIRYFGSSILDKAKILKRIATLIDILVVVNELQADVCNSYFNVPRERIRIVPNIVDEKYFNNEIVEPPLFLNDYILTTGNICKRKNQTNLANACSKLNINLIIIGKALEGENEVVDQLDQLIQQNKNIVWIKGLPENSAELVTWYKNCIAYALPSHDEKQPISALEAVATKKPLLLGNKAYARQRYYQNAKLVNPNSISSITSGIKDIINNPTLYIPSDIHIQECKASYVGDAYKAIYMSL